VEGARGFCQRRHFLNCSDFRRISLVGYAIRISPLRLRSYRPVAATWGRTTPQQLHSLLMVSHDGTLWIGTLDGLDRFREYTIPTMSLNQGLSNSTTWTVQATSDGSIWVGAAEGVNRWVNGHVTAYRGRRALGKNRRADEAKVNTSGAGNHEQRICGHSSVLGSR